MKELDGKQILLESKERECSTLSKLLEINREKELVVVAERLDINRVACVNNSVFSKISFFSLLYCLCFQVLCCNHCGVEIIKLGFDFRNVYINYQNLGSGLKSIRKHNHLIKCWESGTGLCSEREIFQRVFLSSENIFFLCNPQKVNRTRKRICQYFHFSNEDHRFLHPLLSFSGDQLLISLILP